MAKKTLWFKPQSKAGYPNAKIQQFNSKYGNGGVFHALSLNGSYALPKKNEGDKTVYVQVKMNYKGQDGEQIFNELMSIQNSCKLDVNISGLGGYENKKTGFGEMIIDVDMIKIIPVQQSNNQGHQQNNNQNYQQNNGGQGYQQQAPRQNQQQPSPQPQNQIGSFADFDDDIPF